MPMQLLLFNISLVNEFKEKEICVAEREKINILCRFFFSGCITKKRDIFKKTNNEKIIARYKTNMKSIDFKYVNKNQLEFIKKEDSFYNTNDKENILSLTGPQPAWLVTP